MITVMQFNSFLCTSVLIQCSRYMQVRVSGQTPDKISYITQQIDRKFFKFLCDTLKYWDSWVKIIALTWSICQTGQTC